MRSKRSFKKLLPTKLQQISSHPPTMTTNKDLNLTPLTQQSPPSARSDKDLAVVVLLFKIITITILSRLNRILCQLLMIITVNYFLNLKIFWTRLNNWWKHFHSLGLIRAHQRKVTYFNWIITNKHNNSSIVAHLILLRKRGHLI